MRTLNTIWLGGLGAPVITFAGSTRTPALLNQVLPANANHNQSVLRQARGIILPSQSALRLRELVGASRTVLRGPSLGELTSAGASNSQAAQHVRMLSESGESKIRRQRHPVFAAPNRSKESKGYEAAQR